jgi:hypothetical protein
MGISALGAQFMEDCMGDLGAADNRAASSSVAF